MTVYSFEAWKESGIRLEMNEPCARPFHFDQYIMTDEDTAKCLRCNVEVKIKSHPSFGDKWYG